MQRTYKITIAVLVMLVVIGGFLVYTREAHAPSAVPEAQLPIVTASLRVQGVYQDKQVVVPTSVSALELLVILDAQDPALNLQTEEYQGLGTLVIGMGSLVNGTDGNYWQYTVNGIMPQVGADQYRLKDGDVVEWYFGASQY